MKSGRSAGWLRWIIGGVALVIVAVPSLWVYMSLTAEPLHRDQGSVPRIRFTAPAAQVAAAAKRGEQLAVAHLMETNLPGLSVAVGLGDEVVWAEGFGFADLQTSTPVTPEHRFRIGTASTVLTSAAAGLLLESGQWKLEDEVQQLVPAFPRKPWPVRWQNVMGHTAGLVADGGDEGPLFTRHCAQPVEALSSFGASPLAFEPGTEYRDSNYDWILVSAGLEAAAKQPFLALMRERVFAPLNMQDTLADGGAGPQADDDHPLFNLVRELFVDPRTKRPPAPKVSPSPGAAEQVTAYFPRFAADPRYGLHLMRPLDYSCYAGASVFVSTPVDLVRFGLAMQNGRLLKPETVARLQAAQRLRSGQETGYGLGWERKTVTLRGKRTQVVGHDGDSLGGMVASLVMVPEYRLVIAVTSNISYADTFGLAAKLAEVFTTSERD